MHWRGKAKAFRKFIWENLDPLLVIVAAFGIVILDVAGASNPDLVASAILALLGVMAIALIRDRTEQLDLDDLRQLASDAVSDRPYEVVWQTNEWELKDRVNTTVRVTEQLRFTRNDVSTIADWSTGDGTVARYSAKWRRTEHAPWIPATMIYKFPIRNGEKVIYSLDEEHSRGDMLDWCIERDAVGRFPTNHESVSLRARTRADHPRVMRITWPRKDAPSHVEIRCEGKPARTLSTKRKRGRRYIEEKIAGLSVGEAVVIGWTW